MQDLQRRIVAETGRSPCADVGDTCETDILLWGKLGYAALGAAVTLVAGAVWLRLLPVRAGPSVAAKGEVGGAALVLSEGQVLGRKALFAEMERLFSDQLRWVSLSDGEMGVGVEAIAGGVREGAAPMLVRLAVVSRKAGEKEWKTAWNADVILREEERVEVAAGRKADNRVALWVYPLAEGRVAVDTSLSLVAPVEVASSVSAVVKRGQPAEVLSLTTGETEYRVVQTVQTL